MCLHDEFECWPISCKKTQNMLQNHSKTPWINLTLKTTLFEVWTAANFSRNSFEVKKKTGQLCLFNFPKPQFLHLGGCEFMSQKVLWWQKNFVRFELICSYLLIIIIGVSLCVCLIIGPYQHDIKKSVGWPCPKWNI